MFFSPLFYSTSYCCCASFSWRSLQESWPISTTSRWVSGHQSLETQIREREQLIIIPLLQPKFGLDAWNIGLVVVHLLTPLHIQKTLDYLLVLTKWWSLLQGGLLSPAAQLLPVVHFVPWFSADPCRRQFLRLFRSRNSVNSLQGIVQATEITSVPFSMFRTQEQFLLHLAKVMNGPAERSFQVKNFLRALLKQCSWGTGETGSQQLQVWLGTSCSCWEQSLSHGFVFKGSLTAKAQTACKVALMSGNWLEVAN